MWDQYWCSVCSAKLGLCQLFSWTLFVLKHQQHDTAVKTTGPSLMWERLKPMAQQRLSIFNGPCSPEHLHCSAVVHKFQVGYGGIVCNLTIIVVSWAPSELLWNFGFMFSFVAAQSPRQARHSPEWCTHRMFLLTNETYIVRVSYITIATFVKTCILTYCLCVYSCANYMKLHYFSPK